MRKLISMLALLVLSISVAQAGPIRPIPIKTPIVIKTPIIIHTPIATVTPVPTRTPIVVPTISPTPGNFGCNGGATLANCQNTGNLGKLCRKFFKDECSKLIEADFVKQVQAFPANPKLTANPKTKEIVSVRKVNNTAKDFNFTGHNSTLRDMQFAFDLASYQQNLNLPLSPVARLALIKKSTWQNSTGYTTCEDFAMKSFPKLSRVEEIVGRYPYDVTEAVAIINSDNDLSRTPFAYNQTFVDTKLFDKRQAVAAKTFNEVFGTSVGDWTVISNWESDDDNFWIKNSFVNSKLLDNWYPKLCGAPLPDGSGNCIPPLPSQDPRIKIPSNLLLAINMGAGKKSLRMQDQLNAANYLRRVKGYTDDFLDEVDQAQAQYRNLWAIRRLIQQRYEIRIYNNDISDDDPWGTAEALAAVDKEIIASLRQASAWGCFNSSETTVCDWSPRLMKATLNSSLNHYRDYREGVYKFCQVVAKDTHDIFYKVPTVAAQPLYAHVYDRVTGNHGQTLGNLFVNNPNLFNTYFVDAAKYYLAVAAEMAQIRSFSELKDSAGLPEMGQVRNDSGFMGTDFLGLGETGGGYSYNLTWKIADYDKRVCNPSFYGDYNYQAYTTVLGKRIEALRFSATTKADSVSESSNVSTLLEVQNNVMTSNFDRIAGDNNLVGGNNYNFVSTPSPWAKNYGEFSSVIVVAGIPVTLAGGASYEAGYSLNLKNSFDQSGCPGEGGDTRFEYRAKPFMMNKGRISPYTRAVLFASASVDAGILEVGVRGAVNLIQISMPWTIDNEMKARIVGVAEPYRDADNQPTLYANNNVDLRVNTLAGTVSAFVDYTFSSLDFDLFSWGGFNHDANLSSTSTNFSLYFAKQTLKEGKEPPKDY